VHGLWQVFFGNYFYYKREIRNEATIRKYTPDYRPDLVDRIPFIRYGTLGGLLIFMGMFGWMWGLAAWSFHVVAYILLNSSINSLCHMIGYRNYDNQATNLRLIAWMTGGEGLHNNHHEHPSSAKFSRKLTKREFDPAWTVICLLQRCGLARVKPEPVAKAA
jgi:stearoyl-CoA desaturase (delta-9 desaturase)